MHGPLHSLQRRKFRVFPTALTSQPTSRPSSVEKRASGVFVGYGLWTARAHLGDVLRKCWRGGSDAGEVASYRFCIGGALLGATGMVLWLWRSGLPLWIACLVVVTALGILVALARIVAEAGTPTITPGMVPAGFTVSAVGVPALGAKGMLPR